jgi:16S rRNA C967 or C1407 C5-methylase (RsmB/RsmF family)/NOL1/NOP2/fmu family ribosome biogenesis protein
MTTPIAYPPQFLERMRLQLGDGFEEFVRYLDFPAPTSIRLNPCKRISKFDKEEKISWCDEGRYLKERPSFTFDPLFHAGTYYVQESSSMFIEEVWKQINPGNASVKVLDLCAAPGGKSTHLLSLMGDDSLLVGNEVIPTRNKILQQNIIKWGYANCIITQNKPADFAVLENYFDIVLIDAPCSGEGLFRKDKDAIAEWSEKNVGACSIRQKEILQHAYACLKPGGFLIYSTCTFESTENDENMQWLEPLGAIRFKMETSKYQGIVATDYGYQFYPHKIKGEGFYIAVFKKEGELNLGSEADKKTNQTICHPDESVPIAIGINVPLSAEHYLKQPENFHLHQKNELTFAIPKFIKSDFNFLEKQLYIRQAGIFMGTQKGKDFLPSHDLALSNHIRPDLSAIELTYDQAVAYLRCETPRLQTDILGWRLVSYQGFNLGWVKVLQGRINNYFPKEWRILKQNK